MEVPDLIAGKLRKLAPDYQSEFAELLDAVKKVDNRQGDTITLVKSVELAVEPLDRLIVDTLRKANLATRGQVDDVLAELGRHNEALEAFRSLERLLAEVVRRANLATQSQVEEVLAAVNRIDT